MPLLFETRDGNFMHFPTEECHVGFLFNDEMTCTSFANKIEYLNMYEEDHLKKNLKVRSKIDLASSRSSHNLTSKTSATNGFFKRFRKSASPTSIPKALSNCDLKSMHSDFTMDYSAGGSLGSTDSINYCDSKG